MKYGTLIVAWQRKLLMKHLSKQWKSAFLTLFQSFFFSPSASTDSEKCVIKGIAVICTHLKRDLYALLELVWDDVTYVENSSKPISGFQFKVILS